MPWATAHSRTNFASSARGGTPPLGAHRSPTSTATHPATMTDVSVDPREELVGVRVAQVYLILVAVDREADRLRCLRAVKVVGEHLADLPNHLLIPRSLARAGRSDTKQGNDRLQRGEIVHLGRDVTLLG